MLGYLSQYSERFFMYGLSPIEYANQSGSSLKKHGNWRINPRFIRCSHCHTKNIVPLECTEKTIQCYQCNETISLRKNATITFESLERKKNNAQCRKQKKKYKKRKQLQKAFRSSWKDI